MSKDFDVVKPNKEVLQILALWFLLHDITEPKTMVRRDDLALGLLELGILRGQKRRILRAVGATAIPQTFMMSFAGRYAVMMFVVCPTNNDWARSAREWLARNHIELVNKGALKVQA